jgi:serine/threonine protein kinase
MSPESLQTRRVTRKHDVWAYGVTLLEILHREHDEPYIDKGAMEVAAGVAQMRLRPTFAPAVMAAMPDMVAMAKWCMAWLPVQRPSFDAVLQKIVVDAIEPAPSPALKRPPTLALPIVPTPSLSLKPPSGSTGATSPGVISRSPSAGSVFSAPSSASSTPRRSGLYQCGACSQRFNSASVLEDHLLACVAAARTSDDGGGRSPRKLELPPSSPSLDVLARWRIDWNDLNRPPPVLIGEGFHSLVLGANWRGARVALKLHKRVAGGQQSGAIRAGGQTEFDTEQIEAERLNRVAAAAEDAKDISSLLDVHADEIIAEAQLMANLSPHPNCVQLLGICAAVDHQMLTNRGFLFLDQVLALVERDDAGSVTDWRGLRVANYDPATMQLVYDEPRTLIVSESDELVEFTSSSAASARDPLVSVLTTPEHELFVLPASSKRSMTRDETQPTLFAKLAAEKALAHEAVHFLARAENGIDVSCGGAPLDDAQLELYGRWLNGGAARRADGALLLRDGLASTVIDDECIAPLCEAGVRLGEWCWSLPAAGARAILRGLREGEHIYTDDAEFRDQVVRLALHAGFTCAFDRVSSSSSMWRIVLAEASNVDRPLLRRSVDQVARVKNPHADRRVWCFRMPRRADRRVLDAAGGGFVVMRRAALGDDGATIMHASRPTVQGNCFSPFLIVTEFMPGGSLRALLDMGGIRIDERMRIDILADVAAGMRHLNLEGILHKDLAARNVLLAGAPPTLRAKVCDFGLSRVLSDAEHASTTEPGPTKWLPRESLLEWKFSSASDVWMFAITAIEVLTRQLPYPDMPHQQYIALLVSRQLDPFERVPADTNPLLARCLRQCLSQVPAERPSFEAICATLDQCRHPQSSPAPVRRPTQRELNTYN